MAHVVSQSGDDGIDFLRTSLVAIVMVVHQPAVLRDARLGAGGGFRCNSNAEGFHPYLIVWQHKLEAWGRIIASEIIQRTFAVQAGGDGLTCRGGDADTGCSVEGVGNCNDITCETYVVRCAVRCIAGKRVLWACRQLMLLSDKGRLDMEEPMFGKAADVEAMEKQVAELESMLKQAQGGEVSYVDSINQQMTLIRFYRNVMESLGVIVDEEHFRYRTGKDGIWHVPILKWQSLGQNL